MEVVFTIGELIWKAEEGTGCVGDMSWELIWGFGVGIDCIGIEENGECEPIGRS